MKVGNTNWAGATLVALVAGVLLATAGGAQAEQVLHYRGYFSGPVVERPLDAFYYRADLRTVQPAFYYHYRTQPFLLKPPTEQRASTGGRVGEEKEAALISPVPLPGQYWYRAPGQWAPLTRPSLGWPYGGQ